MRSRTLFLLLLVLALLASACGGDTDESADGDADDDGQIERDVTDVDATTRDDAETTTSSSADEPEPEIAPAVTPSLTATVDGSTITLAWPDTDLLRWEVYRDGRELDTVADSGFVDTELVDGAYRYQVVAIGTEGDQMASDVVIAQVGDPDLIAPPAPTAVSLDADDSVIVITWEPPRELDDVRGYLVHRDRVFIAYVDDGTEYVDTAIEPGRAYNYRIRSEDDAGNVSEPEAARVSGETDTTAPSAPANAVLDRIGGEIVITWDESIDDQGIWGYLIHRDGEFVEWTGLDQEFREAAPANGTTPAYVVRAQDFTGNFSVPSRAFPSDVTRRIGGSENVS